MVTHNVDHLDVRLRPFSREASAQFLNGGAAFHEILAALEKEELPIAANAAKRAVNSFENATRSFVELSGLIQSNEYSWIGHATREIDFDAAARTVYLSPDSDLVRRLNAELVKGNLYNLFVISSQEIANFSEKLRAFADRASGSNVILDDEYQLAHELLRDWGEMIAEGQYISSVCLAAATQKSVL